MYSITRNIKTSISIRGASGDRFQCLKLTDSFLGQLPQSMAFLGGVRAAVRESFLKAI